MDSLFVQIGDSVVRYTAIGKLFAAKENIFHAYVYPLLAILVPFFLGLFTSTITSWLTRNKELKPYRIDPTALFYRQRYFSTIIRLTFTYLPSTAHRMK